MNFSDIFTLTQKAEIENPSLFPFPFEMHLIFACIGAVFFAYRFFTQKRPFQLIMAIAIPASLIIWLAESSRTLFYGVGIAEAVLILAAIVTSYIFKPKDSADESDDDGDKDSVDGSAEESDTDSEDETEEQN